MLFITHDLGIVRKHRRHRLRDAHAARSSSRGPDRTSLPPHLSIAYTQALLAAEPKPDPAPPRPRSAGRDFKTVRSQGLVSDQARAAAQDRRPYQGGGRRERSRLRKGETLGVVGESGSGKTTLGLAMLRLISSERTRSCFMSKQYPGVEVQADAAVPPRHADRISGSVTARSARACRSADIIAEGTERAPAARSMRGRARARVSWSRRSRMSVSIPATRHPLSA